MLTYTWFVVSQTIWMVNTIHGLKQQDKLCFNPCKSSIMNLVMMIAYYTLQLSPYLGLICFLPQLAYLFMKEVNSRKAEKLARFYLIKRMPSVIFNKKMFENGFVECSICMETFKEGHDFVSPLACDARHFYHSDCIEQWLKNKNECPLCKIE